MERDRTAAPGDLVDAVLASLSAEERASLPVYVDTVPWAAGRILEVEAGSVVLTSASVVAFIDEQPGANWFHRCRYVVIDLATQAARTIPASRPPFFGPLPSTWRLASRPPSLESWQLLPFSDQPG